MKILKIIEDDRLGLLMDISYILGKNKINIENISVITTEGKAIILLQVRDEKKVKEILKNAGFNVLEDDVVLVKLKDRPGELAKISKMLTENGISIENLYVISKAKGEAYVSLSVDHPRKARNVLKEFSVEKI